MKLNRFIIFLMVIHALRLSAQEQEAFTYIKTIRENVASFAVDNLDNLYLLSTGNQLKKLNAAGDSVGVFNDIRKYGKLTYMDVSNPLRVLLYYKDFSTVVVLDRFLNIRSTIDLRKQDIFQVQAIGLSYDNKIWLYDEFENKLKKIDEDGKLLFETADFRQLFNEQFTPAVIFDENRQIYLYDPKKGMMAFDYYGALKNKIALLNWSNFRVTGSYLFGTRNDSLIRYHPATLTQKEWLLPANLKTAQKLSFTNTHLFALKKEGLEIYLIR